MYRCWTNLNSYSHVLGCYSICLINNNVHHFMTNCWSAFINCVICRRSLTNSWSVGCFFRYTTYLSYLYKNYFFRVFIDFMYIEFSNLYLNRVVSESFFLDRLVFLPHSIHQQFFVLQFGSLFTLFRPFSYVRRCVFFSKRSVQFFLVFCRCIVLW